MPAPRTIITDFETFYDVGYSVREMSYPMFIRDRRFKVHGLAVDDGNRQDWIEPRYIPKFLASVKDDILVAHNGYFDFGIMRWHYDFRPRFMVDTLGVANHVLGSARDLGGTANNLATLAEKLGLPVRKGKLELKGVRDPDEAQTAALAVYAKTDAKLARLVLNALLPYFSNPDFEFWIMDHTLRIYLERPMDLDPEKLRDTKDMVERRQAELLAASGTTRDVLASDKQFAEHLTCVLKEHKLKLPTKKPAKPRKDGSNPSIPALSKNDPAFVKLGEHENPKIANLVQARLAIRSAATVTARLATMQAYLDAGMGIPVHLVYYGAHTGRYAGGGGFNWQNLTSPDRAQTEVERVMAQAVREAIHAGKGMVFVPVDAAQIEARVLAWLAGERSILDAFASGADIYSDFISFVLGEKIYKPTGTEPPEVQKHLNLMRAVGKKAVLGLGYQMGADKFFKQLKAENKDVAKMIEAGKITLEMAAEIVRSYRDRYQKIVAFWTKIDSAFHAARLGATRKVGPLTLRRIKPLVGKRPAVGIDLPSGRTLYYHEVRQEGYNGVPKFTGLKGKAVNAKIRPEWKHGGGQKIYGGLLTENIVQAISRDILCEAIYAAEADGREVAASIHDEVICRVPEAKGKETEEFLVKALSTPPEWGQGMVLSAEGRVSRSMGK